MATFKTISDYIKAAPKEAQPALRKMNALVKATLPGAEGVISYNIPCYKLNGKYVIYFAGFKQHVSLYPIYANTPKLKTALKPYTSGKATAKFPLNKPLPVTLIKQLVRYRQRSNQ